MVLFDNNSSWPVVFKHFVKRTIFWWGFVGVEDTNHWLMILLTELMILRTPEKPRGDDVLTHMEKPRGHDFLNRMDRPRGHDVLTWMEKRSPAGTIF